MDYTGICIKVINGKATESEKKIFNDWVSFSEENLKMYKDIELIWNTADVTIPDNFQSKEIEWEAIKSRINSETVEAKQLIMKPGLSFSLFALKPAYTLLTVLLLILAIVVFTEPGEKISVEKIFTIATANMEKKDITLPDGSKIILNSGSSISYSNLFSEENRKINLSGEAFFDVEKNSHPFIITAGRAEIEVLGTKFGVWTREERTRVVVEEGKVNLSNKFEDKQSVQLQKNQLGCLSGTNGLIKNENIDSKKYLAWIENKLRFNNTSLNDILWEFKKYYGRELRTTDSSLNSLTLTGEFENENPEEAVIIICLALNLDFEKSGDGFILKKKHGD